MPTRSHPIPPGNRSTSKLVEAVVAAGIIAVLATVLVPIHTRALEEDQVATCANNLRQLATAVHQYLSDNDARFPFSMVHIGTPEPPECRGEAWGRLVLPYVQDREVFICPTHGKGPLFDTAECGYLLFFLYDGSYGINQGATNQTRCGWTTGRLPAIRHPEATVLIAEATGTGAGGRRAHAGIGGPPGGPGGHLPRKPGPYRYPPADPCGWWGSPWDTFDYRHNATANVAFVDGHVKGMAAAELEHVGSKPYTPDYTLWDRY